jgi:hypothetical protein
VYDPPVTFTILSDRWVGNTGCPAELSTKGGHPDVYTERIQSVDGGPHACRLKWELNLNVVVIFMVVSCGPI